MSDDNDCGTPEENRVNPAIEYGPEPWKRPERLRMLYWEEWNSQYEIADRFDISQPTVKYWFDKFDIETRSPKHDQERRGIYTNTEDHRTRFFIDSKVDGDGPITFYMSALAVLENYSVHEVFNEGTDNHHRLGSPLKLNLPENVEPVDKGQHRSDHANGEATVHPDVVLHEIFGEDDETVSVAMDHDRRLARIRTWKRQANNA